MGGLDTRRQLVDTLAIVKMFYDLRGQVDILCLGLRLLPEVVEDLEEFGVNLLWLAWDRERAVCNQVQADRQTYAAQRHIETLRGKNTCANSS